MPESDQGEAEQRLRQKALAKRKPQVLGRNPGTHADAMTPPSPETFYAAIGIAPPSEACENDGHRATGIRPGAKKRRGR